jgi:hypothetical protein
MDLIILDKKEIEHRTWYLCKGSLLDYLDGLKTNFYDYAIQRRIVKNQYLDKLYSTIKVGDPIPTITLTYNKKTLDEITENKAFIDLYNTEILDGLQRSFRLWSYLTTSQKYSDNQLDYRTFARELKLSNPLFFDSGVISTTLLRELIESQDILNIPRLFNSYEIYFIIWSGLNEKETIQKMLLLNAGQKSVSKTHQFELLFLHFFEMINNKQSLIKLYREKDVHATDIKKGNREIGHFMFSSVIIALQSMVEKKPIRISTEKLIEEEFKDSTETTETIYDRIFNSEFLNHFLTQLHQLDYTINEFEKHGKEWFSKDTSLSGLFAAVGKNINFNEDNIKDQITNVLDNLKYMIQKKGLKIGDFTAEYNTLSSRSVNIGNFIRIAVMNYISALLQEKEITWKEIFNTIKEN